MGVPAVGAGSDALAIEREANVIRQRAIRFLVLQQMTNMGKERLARADLLSGRYRFSQRKVRRMFVG